MFTTVEERQEKKNYLQWDKRKERQIESWEKMRPVIMEKLLLLYGNQEEAIICEKCNSDVPLISCIQCLPDYQFICLDCDKSIHGKFPFYDRELHPSLPNQHSTSDLIKSYYKV